MESPVDLPAPAVLPARVLPNGWAESCDALVIGGGFYGACIALFLRASLGRVILLEARDDILTRASFVNQARVHTGFHYPRSFVTARRSLALHTRFIEEFRPAVADDFTMLYAIARWGSKVTATRFVQMFRDMGAPIAAASAAERALFNPEQIAEVVRCREVAFDADTLRRLLRSRLDAAGVRVVTGATVTAVRPHLPPEGIVVDVADRPPVAAPVVFNATYGQLPGDEPPLKYELSEIVLADPPPELARYGVTVMDGPFFSFMPFPARGCHSLTHVRYTPHRTWQSGDGPAAGATPLPRTAGLHMQRDAVRFLPCLARLAFRSSLFEVKAVPLKRESDDGRPILMSRNPVNPGLFTVLGGKLDNVYDLISALVALGPPFAIPATSGRTEAP